MIILAETDQGYLIFEGNELTVGSKYPDPPKVRQTSPITSEGGGGGVISMNASRHDGICGISDQTEMSMIRTEQASSVRGDVNNPKAEMSFQLQDGGGLEDRNMRKPLAFEYNALTNLLLPLGTGGGSNGASMRSPNGRWLTQQQDDGNLVQYDMSDPSHPRPVWSSWTGPIG